MKQIVYSTVAGVMMLALSAGAHDTKPWRPAPKPSPEFVAPVVLPGRRPRRRVDSKHRRSIPRRARRQQPQRAGPARQWPARNQLGRRRLDRDVARTDAVHRLPGQPRRAVHHARVPASCRRRSTGSSRRSAIPSTRQLPPFSPVRLFSAIDSTSPVEFFVPGGGDIPPRTASARFLRRQSAGRPAAQARRHAREHGAAVLRRYGELIYSSVVPPSPGDASLSFFGVAVRRSAHRPRQDRQRRRRPGPRRGTAQGRRGDGRLHLRGAEGGKVGASVGDSRRSRGNSEATRRSRRQRIDDRVLRGLRGLRDLSDVPPGTCQPARLPFRTATAANPSRRSRRRTRRTPSTPAGRSRATAAGARAVGRKRRLTRKICTPAISSTMPAMFARILNSWNGEAERITIDAPDREHEQDAVVDRADAHLPLARAAGSTSTPRR